MNNQRPPTRKSTLKKLTIIAVAATATAYGSLAWINRDTDPTTWKTERSGYEETK